MLNGNLKTRLYLLAYILFLLFPANAVWARTIYVPQDYAKIQQAIDVSEKGDTIKVSPGIYYENIVIPDGRSLISDDNQTTTIADSGQGPPDAVVTLAGDCVLDGFTITGARGAGLGHAVVVSRGSPKILNNIVRDNSYTGIGIHAELYHTSALVKGNIIYGNGGAGIANYGQQSESLITRNDIHDNYNAGVVSTYYASPTIEENNIYHNSVGVAVRDDASAVINKNIITSNKLVGITVLKNSKARITKNKSESNGTVGINVDMNSEAEVLDNSVSDNGAEAIYFKGNSKGIVDSNQIIGNLPTLLQIDLSVVRITRNAVSSTNSTDNSLTVSIDRSYCLMGGNTFQGGLKVDESSQVIDLSLEDTPYRPNPLPFWKVDGGLNLPKWELPKAAKPTIDNTKGMQKMNERKGADVESAKVKKVEAIEENPPVHTEPKEPEKTDTPQNDAADSEKHTHAAHSADKTDSGSHHGWGCLGLF